MCKVQITTTINLFHHIQKQDKKHTQKVKTMESVILETRINQNPTIRTQKRNKRKKRKKVGKQITF